MKNEIVALFLAIVLLYGCTQAQESGGVSPDTTGQEPAAGTGGPTYQESTGDAFQELDAFYSAETEILEPDLESDFVFDETQLQ